MGLDPSTFFAPRIIAPSLDYPYGSAVDDSTGTTGDGTPLLAAGMNDWFGLMQWLLDQAGITPSGNPDTVLASDYGAALMNLFNGASGYYDDGGAVNAYDLNPAGGRQGPQAYLDGMRVSFYPANANTGPSTVNVNGIGVKDIRLADNTALPAGAIRSGTMLASLTYRASGDYFELDNKVFRALKGAPANDADIKGYTFARDGDTGLFAEGGSDVLGSHLVLRADGIDIGKFTTSDVLKSGNGYAKLPSGIILQWGVVSVAASSVIFVFPIAFPTAPLAVYASLRDKVGGTLASQILVVPGAARTTVTASILLGGYDTGTWAADILVIGY